MKPLMIHGHTRPLTQIKFNREGDLFFSAAKDKVPSVWYARNGERLGTFEGHNGSVWDCTVDYTTKYFVTGSADNSLKVWDIETGKELCSFEEKSAIRSINFSHDSQRLLYTTDNIMGQPCLVKVVDFKHLMQQGQATEASMRVVSETKVTASLWGMCDDTIIAATNKGEVRIYDSKTHEITQSTQPHKLWINDLQYSKDMSMFITACKDSTAKLLDASDLSVIKTYETSRPINSASISPLRDHVVLGGGQEARDVTTTHGKQGKFDALFFHMVFGEMLGSVKGHFGPINTLTFSPDGRGYVSGGEEGYIRAHRFDPSYFDFEFEY